MKICRIEDCKRKITTASWSGLCAQHMKNLRVWGDTDGDPKAEKRRPKDCEIEGCERPFYSQGLCAAHHSRMRRKGDVQADVPIGFPVGVVVRPRICAQQGCDAALNPSAHRARKYCDAHSTAQAIAKRSNVAQKARNLRERESTNNKPVKGDSMNNDAVWADTPGADWGKNNLVDRDPGTTVAGKRTTSKHMKLKVVQSGLAGRTAQIWIDDEPVMDGLSLTLNINPGGYTTATITRLVDDVEFDGYAEGATADGAPACPRCGRP